MTDFPPGQHSGTVRATGWRRDNRDINGSFTFATPDGFEVRIIFSWKHQRKFLQHKRIFTTIILPSLGAGWDRSWALLRFVAGPTQIKFPAQMMNDANWTATCGLDDDVTAMMHDFFACETAYVFELHGAEGLVMAMPMTNDPEAYLVLSNAVERSSG